MPGIDKTVMRSLRFGGLQEENLKELVGIVSRFSEAGLKPVKVFPKGIPAPDGAWIHTLLDFDRLQTLFELVRETGRIDTIRIFPKGIPIPDVYHAEIGIR